jgi:putative restriction endonuclease
VYNGLLLAAHLDAAFDSGLISFGDDGRMLIAAAFAQADQLAPGIAEHLTLRRVATSHLPNLAWHREFLFGK